MVSRDHETHVDAVLAGDASYDDLGEQDQQAVLAAWQERLAVALATANLEAVFQATGETYAEADTDGNLVIRDPDEG